MKVTRKTLILVDKDDLRDFLIHTNNARQCIYRDNTIEGTRQFELDTNNRLRNFLEAIEKATLDTFNSVLEIRQGNS